MMIVERGEGGLVEVGGFSSDGVHGWWGNGGLECLSDEEDEGLTMKTEGD